MRTQRHRDIGTWGHRGRWAWEHRDIRAWGQGAQGTERHEDAGHRGVEKWDVRTRDMGTWGPESSAEQQQAAARAENGESQKRHKKSGE